MLVHESDANFPPPSSQTPPPSSQLAPLASQSHFAKFDNFTPDDDASFDDEFARLALSQQWVVGSQEYTRERTIAMREELNLLYFSQAQPLADIDEEPKKLNEEQILRGYQDLCNEVGIPPSNSIDECKKHLKSTLVNIVDLIDARRTRSVVMVWDDFDAFRRYTLQDAHRINKEEAKKGEGFLASLLQDFKLPQAEWSGGAKDIAKEMSPDANHLRQGVARFDTGWKPFEIEGVGQADVAGVEDAAVLFVRYDGVREASVDEQLRHRVTTAFKSKVLSKFF